MPEEVDFNTSHKDDILIGQIVDRIDTISRHAGVGSHDIMGLRMDITACHLNGCPLKLQELLESAPHDLGHDVLGISRHIDRSTGKLTQCFLPRYALS